MPHRLPPSAALEEQPDASPVASEPLPESPPPVPSPASSEEQPDASPVGQAPLAEAVLLEVASGAAPDAPLVGEPPLAEVVLPEAPLGAPLRPRHAAEPLASDPLAAVAATSPSGPLAETVALSQLSEGRVIGRLLQLARDIRRPRTYVGYSTFLCFCLARKCRAFFWEGDHRIDLLQVQAPWAIESCTGTCAVDGVCCCLVHADEGGEVSMMPVSETHPLSMCSHFVAAVRMEGVSHEGGPGLQGYYSSRGVAVLGTVMDGECGIDVACQMVGEPQTLSQRDAMREELSDYLLARVKMPWMQELMAALQEVDPEDVRQIHRRVADVPIAVASGEALEDTPPHAAVASSVSTAVAVADQELRREAIQWATGSTDHAFITNLVASLPPAVLDEQVQLYQASKCGQVVPYIPPAMVVYPHLLKSRQEAAQAFDMALLDSGWAPGTRLPRNAATKFVGKLVWSKSAPVSLSDKAKALRRWHVQFRQMPSDEPSRSSGAIVLRKGAARPLVEHGRRQGRFGLQGSVAPVPLASRCLVSMVRFDSLFN